MNGWIGKILRINLSEEKITEEKEADLLEV